MAAPAWLAPAIQGGTGIAGGVISAAVQGKRDHDARTFAWSQGETEWQRNREAWNLQNQRDDELWNRQNAKNLELWNMTNKFNSPAAQMQRFKEAGLNPNLIYGQMSNAGSPQTANATTPSLSGSRAGNWKPSVPDFSFISNTLMQMLGVREKSVQIDNLKEQNNVLRQEAAYKDAARLAMLSGRDESIARTNRSNYDLDLEKSLTSVSVEARKAALQQLQKDIELQQKRYDRETPTIEAQLNLIRQQTGNSKLDHELKQLELDLKKHPKGTEYLDRMSGALLKYLESTLPAWWRDMSSFSKH